MNFENVKLKAENFEYFEFCDILNFQLSKIDINFLKTLMLRFNV